jgi:ABC-type uncharacterized transport system auxiliary subunit
MNRIYWMLAVGIALSGCLAARPVTPTQHFVIEPVLQVKAAQTTGLTLGIRPLECARPYELPMAYLDSDHFLGYRPLVTWAEKPASSVTRAITDALSLSKRFSDTGSASEMARPDLTLTGELRKFHENRTKKPSTAEVEVRLELRKTLGNGLIWADTLHAETPIANASAGALASAMSAAVSQIADTAAKGIAGAEIPK